MTTVLDLDTGVIGHSPFNHRKKFTGLDELAASIKAKGVISPVTVRETPSTSPFFGTLAYELVVGERRWRATKRAGLPTIPAIVRDLTDKEVLEVQLIENVQRVDVHPLEEADGFEELIEKHGYDVDQVAAKTGKSKAYVYARLKLGSLAEGPRKAFLDDRLSASTALLIARIPDVGLQEQATKDVLGEIDFFDEAAGHIDLSQDPTAAERREISVADENGKMKLETLPMSVREAQIHLQRKYMLRLELATFELADVQLVPKAGACTSCSYRTGNQRELFSDVRSADVCTNPPCFEAKTQAAWNEKAKAATEQGMKVVDKKATERMFLPHDGRTVAGNSPYVDLKSRVPYDLVPMGEKPPTWEKLLGKKLADKTDKVLVQDQTGAPRELLDKKAAIAVLREAGKIDKPEKPTAAKKSSNGSSHDPGKFERERAAREEKEAVVEGALVRALDGVAKNALITAASKELAMWRWIAKVTLRNDDGIERVLVRRIGPKVHTQNNRVGFDHLLALHELIDKAKTIEEIRSIMAELLFSQLGESVNAGYQTESEDEYFEQGCKLLGVKWDELQYLESEQRKLNAVLAEEALAKKSKPAAKAKGKGKP